MKEERVMLRKTLSIVLALAIALSPEYAYAQQLAGTLALPAPGSMVQPSDLFHPAVLRGLMIDSENPLYFDFIVDAGDEKMDQAALKDTTTRLVNYFLASMTVPRGDLWVNLAPVEKDRIIPDGLNKTELGRDLLSQDYLLKQLTATMFNPDQALGKEFWGKVYAQAREKFGTSEIPADTFNKVWIVPQSAQVFEKGNTVYITGGHLKVMLEADYAAANQRAERVGGEVSGPVSPELASVSPAQELSRNITREIILPAIEKEVNEGRNFAGLRQMFYSLVLAQWYQDVFKDSVINKAYAGHNKVAGIDLNDPQNREVIFQQYLEAYKKGVFSFIREEIDRVSQESLPRRYFSGGAEWNHPVKREPAMSVLASENQYRAAVELAPADRANPAMMSDETDLQVTIGRKTMPLSVARQAVEMIRAELEKGTLPLVMEEPSESPFYGVFREIFGAVARQTGGLRVSVERYDGRDNGSNYVKDNVSLGLSPASRLMTRLGRKNLEGQLIQRFKEALFLYKDASTEAAMQGQADKFVDDQRFQQKAGSGLYEKLPNVPKEKIDLVLAVTQFLELLTNFSQSEEQYDSIAARRALLENPRAVEVILDYLDEVKPGQDDGYPSAMGQIKTVYHEEKARRAIRAFENTLIERLFERGILRINNTNIGIQGRSDKDAVAITFDGVRLTGKPDKNEIAFIYRPNHAYAVTQLVSNNDSRFYKGGVRWGLPTEVDSKGNAIKNPDKTLKMSPAGALRAFQMAYSEANGLSLTQNPKNIISGIAYAGGKTFIGVSLDTLSPADKAAFLTAWGRAAVDIGLIPKYVAGPDVNMTPADMDVIVKAIQERYVEHLKIGLKKVREFGVDPRTFKIEDYNRLIAGDGFLQDDFIQEMRRKVIAALNEGRLDLDTLEFDGQLKTEILKIIGAGATGGTEENGGLPHAKMAVTGHGVIVGAHAVMQYIKDNPEFRAQYHLEPLYQLMLKGKVKTAVQGAGDVGASAALKLARLGYLVVAISDVNGTVHKPEGFTVEELQRLVNSDSKTRNVLNWMPQGAGVKHLAASDLFDGNKVDLDLLVPAAVSKAINKGNLSLLRGADHPDVVSGVRSPLVITEGANISFVDVVADLHQMGILAFNGMALNFGGVFTSYQQDLLMHRFLPAETRRISLKRADGTDILSGASVKVVETVTGRFPGVADASLTITDGVVGQSNVPQVPQGTLIDVWGTDIYSQGDRLPLEGVSVQRSFVISDDQVRGVTLDQDGRVISVANVAGVKEGDVLTFVDNMDEVKKILYTRIEEISRRVNTMVAEVVNLSGMTPSLAAIRIAGVLEEKKGMILRDVNGKYRQATFGIIQGYRDKGYVLSENIERNIAAIELAGQEVLVMGINGRNIVFGPDGRVASGGEAPGEKKESAMSLDTFVHKANLALEKAGPLEFHPVISGVPQTWRMRFSVQIAPAREQTRFDSPLNEPAFSDKGSEGGRDVPVKFIIAREDGYQPEALVVTMASLWMTSFHQPLGEERSKVLGHLERYLPATTIAERLRRVLGVESAMTVSQPEMQAFSRKALTFKEGFDRARGVQGAEVLRERQWRVLDKMFAQGIQWFLDRGALDGLVFVPASDVLAVSLEALRDLEEIEGVSPRMPEMVKDLVGQASEFFMDILEQMDQKMLDGLGGGRFQAGNVLPDAALSGESAMARIVENVEFSDASFVWGENVQVVNPSGETFYAGDFLETIAMHSRKEGGRVLLKNMRLTFSDAGRHAKIAVVGIPPVSRQHESAQLQALDEDIRRVQSSHFPLFSTLGEMRNALWSNDLLRAAQIAQELALQKRPDDPLFNDVIDQVIAYAQSGTGQIHGGIDLNDVRMTREGEIMTAPLSEAGLQEMLMNAPGLRPIIINITPIKDVRPLLGLATDGFVPVADSDAAVPSLARVREEELVGV